MTPRKVIDNCWERASTVHGKDPEYWRRDEENNLLRYGSYGTLGEHGWEIDHRKPICKGGSDHGRNLRALHWEANRRKSDKY